jgi:hypothetical protein
LKNKGFPFFSQFLSKQVIFFPFEKANRPNWATSIFFFPFAQTSWELGGEGTSMDHFRVQFYSIIGLCALGGNISMEIEGVIQFRAVIKRK